MLAQTRTLKWMHCFTSKSMMYCKFKPPHVRNTILIMPVEDTWTCFGVWLFITDKSHWLFFIFLLYWRTAIMSRLPCHIYLLMASINDASFFLGHVCEIILLTTTCTSVIMEVLKMETITSRAGIKAASLAFWTSTLTNQPPSFPAFSTLPTPTSIWLAWEVSVQ